MATRPYRPPHRTQSARNRTVKSQALTPNPDPEPARNRTVKSQALTPNPEPGTRKPRYVAVGSSLD